MSKQIFFGFIILFLISCGVDLTDFSGKWIDKKMEKEIIEINKNGDNYIVNRDNKKYPAQIKDGLLEISTQLPLKATIDKNDNLIIGGDEFIRWNISNTYKLVGIWLKEDAENYWISDALKISLSDENKIQIETGSFENGKFEDQFGEKNFTSIKYSNNLFEGRYEQYMGNANPSIKGNYQIKIINNDKLEYKDEDQTVTFQRQ